ncbi:hypothetical protein SEA_GILSON_143 [Streptomyces phage Gilson]|uniref:Uncharacterized protein n=1 Tax=Streptomyces phage Gilson TaxID=2488789 RepID=A0A3Q9R4T9_9CAUD|nr:hypothetical protein HWB98_gp129 [Streptomyces phage Gilson]AZU97200.1 hypothetical protein SEA_GILSON_143 [Streptomyces phage Gilson]
MNEFLLDKFKREAKQRYRIGFAREDELPGYDKEKHLANCETTSIRSAECEWSCGCYSCYTRDDSFDMSAHVGCDCGVEMRWRYGYMYDLPNFITELDEYKNNEVCSHSDDCEYC